jgi:hypothetical protein
VNKSKSDIDDKFIRAKKLIAKILLNLKQDNSADLKTYSGMNLKLNIDNWEHQVVCALDYKLDL